MSAQELLAAAARAWFDEGRECDIDSYRTSNNDFVLLAEALFFEEASRR